MGCKLSALICNCGRKGQVHIQILNVALISISYGLVGAFCILYSEKKLLVATWLEAAVRILSPRSPGVMCCNNDLCKCSLHGWCTLLLKGNGCFGSQTSSCSQTSIDQLQHGQFHGKWCWVGGVCLNGQFVHTWYFTFLIPTMEILLLECLTCHLAFWVSNTVPAYS